MGFGSHLKHSRKLRTAVLGVLLIYLANPLTWNATYPGPWFPPAGIAILLVAWLGPVAVLLIAVGNFLAAGQAALLGHTLPWGTGAIGIAQAILDTGIQATGALLSWHLYHGVLRAPRRPMAPWTASIFLFLVPGAAAAVLAMTRGFLLVPPAGTSFLSWAGTIWLSQALAILAIVPASLVSFTVPLARARFIDSELANGERNSGMPLRLTPGDAIEIAGLVAGTALLGVLMVVSHWHADTGSWQLWMLALLLIVWASLRQGLRGATAASCSTAITTLVLLSVSNDGSSLSFPLQGYVLALCTTGLLVGVSSDWMQLTEFRGRLLIGHAPLVIYSARVFSRSSKEPMDPSNIEITYLNAAALAVMKRQRDDLLGPYSTWIQNVHPSDREVVLAALAQLGNHEQSVTVEYRVLAPSNEEEVSSSDLALGTASVSELPLASCQPSRQTWVRDTMVPTFDASRRLVGWEGVVLEITEQRLLSDDLRRTTKMFHTLVANLPAGVFFVQGPHGKPIVVNARARELLGQAPDLGARLTQWPEIYRLRRPDGTLYPIDEMPVAVALRQGISSMRNDMVVYRRDGRRIPLVAWAAPLDLRGRGKPDAAVWVFEDMTALRQAEAAHRESEMRLRTLIEIMAEGLLVCDRSGVIIESNPAAASILGMTGDEIQGRSLGDRAWSYRGEDGRELPLEEHPVFQCIQKRTPVQDFVLGVERTVRHPRPSSEDGAASEASSTLGEWWKNGLVSWDGKCPDSGIRWLLVSTRSLMKNGDSRSLRVVTTFTDITPLRSAVNVLRESETRYRGLVESMPLMLIQTDQRRGIVNINPAVTATTGYTLEDLGQADAWSRLIAPDDLGRWQHARETASAGSEERVELRLTARDGSERICLALVQPRQADGAFVGLNILILDLTAHRQLEQGLQRAQRLEVAGRLASGLAHDFNNQLTVILNLVSLAQGQLPADHAVQPDLESIAQAGEQASRLAAQMLTFGKQRKVNKSRINLGASVRRVIDLVHGSLPRNIALEFTDAEPELFVHMDETQLHQVVTNLLLNARDAMPGGGRLTVTIAALSQHDGVQSEGNCWARLSVADEGEGMPESTRQRIFEPFFTTKANGTGLGLAVVQQIIENSGGKLEVTSEMQQGTQFDIHLPAWRQAAVTEEHGEGVRHTCM